MSRILASGDVGNVKPEEFQRYATLVLKDIVDKVNGNLEFGLNLRTQTINVEFTAANTETTVPHSLGRVPQGYILAKSNAATSLYNSTDANAANLYLKSSAIANVTIIVY